MTYLFSRGGSALLFVLAGFLPGEPAPRQLELADARGQGTPSCGHASEDESKAALAETWARLGKDELAAALAEIEKCSASTGCLRRAGAEARLASALRLEGEVHAVRGQFGLALDSLAGALRGDPRSWAAYLTWSAYESMAAEFGAWDPLVHLGEELLRAKAVEPRLENALRFSMARALEQTGAPERARDLYRRLGCANAWAVIGPFNGVAGSGMDRVFEPETGARKEFRDDWGIARAWRRFEDLPDPWIDLPKMYERPAEGIFYGVTIFLAPRAGPALLHLGVGGKVKVWLDGEPILVADEPRALRDDMYEVAVDVHAGENRLVLKLGVDERADITGFSARLTGPDQEPLSGLTWSARGEIGALAPATERTPHDPHWWLYDELLRRHASEPSLENTLALIRAADTGDFEEDLLRTSPALVENLESQCTTALVALHGLAVQARDATLIDRLKDVIGSRSVVTLPGLSIRMEGLNADDRPVEATELARSFLRDAPGSVAGEVALFQQLLAHGTEAEVRKEVEDLERNYPRTPRVAAVVGGLKRRQPDRSGYLSYAEAVWSSNRLDSFATQMLIDAHMAGADVPGTAEFLGQLGKADPTCPLPCFILCQLQTNSKRLSEAEQAAEEALARAPDEPRSMEAWARVLHLQGKKDEARRWYRSALWAQPDDWSMRERYLELSGDDGVLSDFERETTETLVAADRRAPAFPEAHAYLVLGDCQRCVLEDSASRVTFREIGRANDATGVGLLSQRSLEWVVNSIGFTVDKVFTLKADGSRRKGEVKGTTVSFADMEPGDYFELVYTHKVSCLTPMGREVWQARVLASSVPIQLSRFQLIHPRALALTIRTPSRLPFEFEERELAAGYQRKIWSARHVPELEIETGSSMSFIDDYRIDFTSVKDWKEVGQWYERQTYSPSKADRRVEAKARELVEGLSGTDERIFALARYVSDQVAYSSPDFVVEAVRPTDAPQVLQRGQGDCKDKCTLLLAMARSLGIKGSTALVNTTLGRCPPLLPSIRFDHLVAVLQGEARAFWLDPTASYDPALVPRHLEGAQVLLLDGEESRIVEVPVEEASTSSISITTQLSLDREGHGKQTTSARERGAMASSTFGILRAASKPRHAELLASLYAPETGSFSVSGSSIPELDTLGETLEYSFEGERSVPLQHLGQSLLLAAPFQSGSKPPPGLERARTYPFDLTSSKGLIEETVVLDLAPELVPVEVPGPVELTSPELDYRFQLERQGDSRLVFRRSLALKVLEVAPERCAELRRMLAAVAEADRALVSLAVKE